MARTMFFPMKMATANAISIAPALEGNANGDEYLDFNPDNGIKTKDGTPEPSADIDRDALATSGSVTDGGSKAVMVYLKNPADFTGEPLSKIRIESDDNNAFASPAWRGNIPLGSLSADNPIAVFQIGLTFHRYWRFQFQSLQAQADIGILGVGWYYWITPRHVHEQVDTVAQFNSGITLPGGTHFSRNERSVGSRRVTLRFEMITEADIDVLRAVYVVTRGSHFPFFAVIDGADSPNPLYDARLFRFAPQVDGGLMETQIAYDLWTVDMPLEEIRHTPDGYDW